MSVINTNYLALVSQNNLTKSQGALGQAIERLSSGLRINSAKDDAAGQAIANRFTANINGLTQASRNANDGISIAQTTEGALNEINENLQRIRTLTVQASNKTNSTSDLQSIQEEIGQRLKEITRVSEQTQFNGVEVLASDRNLTIQVGAHDNQTISINLKQIDATTLGLGDFQVQNKTDLAEVTHANVGAAFKVGTFSNNGTTAGAPTVDNGELYALKNNSGYAVKADDGKFYTATVGTNGDVSINEADDTGALNADDVNVAAGSLTRGNASVELDTNFTFHVILDDNGIATGDYVSEAGGLYYDVTSVAADGTVEVAAEESSKVFTDDATVNPLQALDRAISKVDGLRSELGAVQNRFQSTIANLSNTVNNLSAARSRIEDADYAVEVSNMTRAQILQQAGTSVLAQANQVPQSVLSLLR